MIDSQSRKPVFVTRYNEQIPKTDFHKLSAKSGRTVISMFAAVMPKAPFYNIEDSHFATATLDDLWIYEAITFLKSPKRDLLLWRKQ